MIKYYPILLSKAGEFDALRNLNDGVIDGIAPIIEVLNDGVTKTVSFIDYWASMDGEIFFDFSYFQGLTTNNVDDIFNSAFDSFIQFHPVIQDNSSAILFSKINSFIQVIPNFEVCLRFSSRTAAGNFDDISNQIRTLQNKLNIVDNQTSILIDLGYIQNNQADAYSNFVAGILNNIPNKQQFKRVIVSCGSFPTDLTDFSAQPAPHFINRSENGVWERINSEAQNRGIVKYSDYGIKNPLYRVADFRGTCSIKYTTERNYIIFRGQKPQYHPSGNGQYSIFSSSLIRRVEYCGQNYSWGDERIFHYANVNPNTSHSGSGRTWVAVSLNHHLMLILNII